jgi:hypothetical protein
MTTAANTYSESTESNQTRALRLSEVLLRPIVRLCLRQGIHFQDLSEALKRVFIDLAQREIGLAASGSSGQPVANVSRISAATGLQRKDIRRLLNPEPVEATSVLARVIGQWQLDPRCLDTDGQPRGLRYGGADCEFSPLVKLFSSDLNPGTLLLELERLGIVSREEHLLRLKTRVLLLSGNSEQALEVAAKESDLLFRAVEENCHTEREIPHLHATTEFTSVRDSALPEVSRWLLEEGSKLHARARQFLSAFDADISSDGRPKEGVSRVSLTTFSLIASDEKFLEKLTA